MRANGKFTSQGDMLYYDGKKVSCFIPACNCGIFQHMLQNWCMLVLNSLFFPKTNGECYLNGMSMIISLNTCLQHQRDFIIKFHCCHLSFLEFPNHVISCIYTEIA